MTIRDRDSTAASPAQVADLFERDKRHVLHPSTHLGEQAQLGSTVITGGEGVYVNDASGKRYIDTGAGLGNAMIGYGNQEVPDAVDEQMRKLMYFPAFFRFSNEPAIELATKLAQLAPPGLVRTFFTSGGTEANESAFKIARLYHKLRGKSEKTQFIARRRAYHGLSYGTLSATGLPDYQRWFGPLMPGFSHIPSPYCYQCELNLTYPSCGLTCIHELEAAILREGPEHVAAFIAEPAQGAGGHIIPPLDYYQVAREICDRYDVLFIADEVVCGFGRTGKMFGAQTYDVLPDIMTMAKGITSGYLPLGAAMIHQKVANVLDVEGKDVNFTHGFTYSAHATCCAAGLKNIEIIERDGLVENSARMGSYLVKRLNELADSPLVGEVAGIGLMAALELVKDKNTHESFAPSQKVGHRVADKAFRRGVIIRASGDRLMFRPPLIINAEQIDEVVDVLRSSIMEVEADLDA